MAHMVESMFSVKENPWHGLGTVLEDAPTGAEAMRLAGLDWTVREEPLKMNDGRFVEAKAIVRDSDNSILGHHVGKDWTPLQNADLFAHFDPLVAAGEASYETAGSLKRGQRVWAMVRLGEDLVIVPKAGDVVRKFLLLANSHDGQFSAWYGITPVRVVCANTLQAAISEGTGSKKKDGKLVKLLHTKNIKATLATLRDVAVNANKRFEQSAEAYRKLAAKEIGAADLAGYVTKVFEEPKKKTAADIIAEVSKVDGASIVADMLAEQDLVSDVLASASDRAASNARARQEMVASLFEHGRGNDLPGVAGTAWAAYNAVSEYLQYERPRTSAESRLESIAFGGDAAKTNARALALALEMSS